MTLLERFPFLTLRQALLLMRVTVAGLSHHPIQISVTNKPEPHEQSSHGCHLHGHCTRGLRD